ncbi:MAG TPA: MBL fold metallo-hydrolase [Bryobacteraceae bacterium]|nr:MBL fold metallo-hydrolase [Bryobacteraceae bacterium]
MTKPVEIAPDLAFLRGVGNIYFAGNRESWTLIDTGGPGYAERIIAAAEARFGAGARPDAIVLTHGHFDHSASALQLARHWDRPVHAHPLEFPYLTGVSAYPTKDPTVGGAVGFLSRFFPTRTANLSEVLRDLPETRTVPGLPGWMWIFTPGHAPGHVAFWRESDGALVAGDALATADLDSWYGVVTQHPRVSRPPSPFTYDWDQARSSVIALAALKPSVIACGHGDPMSGARVAPELDEFARTFAPPEHGRYVLEPAQANEHGVVYEPPKPPDNLPRIGAGVVAGLFLVAGIVYAKRGKKAAAEMDGPSDQAKPGIQNGLKATIE